jgi:hypothetical protein
VDRKIEMGVQIDDQGWKETLSLTGIGDEKNRKHRKRHFLDTSDKQVKGAGEHEHSLEAETDQEPPNYREEKIEGTNIKRWRRINLWTGHKYFYDIDSIRKKQKDISFERVKYEINKFAGHPDEPQGKLLKGKSGGNEGINIKLNPAGRNKRTTWTMGDEFSIWGWLFDGASEGDELSWLRERFGEWVELNELPSTIWDITTKGLKGAHFAVFPRELPEIAIKCGSSERGCCPDCGAPWSRAVRTNNPSRHLTDEPDHITKSGGPDSFRSKHTDASTHRNVSPDGKTKGMYSSRVVTPHWRPTCDCENPETVPCIVLDPFGGSFTTAMVANDLGRDWLSCDLNKDYVEKVAMDRITSKVTSISDPKNKQKELLW